MMHAVCGIVEVCAVVEEYKQREVKLWLQR